MVHLPSRGDLVASTSLAASTLLGAIFVFVVVKLVYWVWIYPFYRSPLRHLPKPKVRLPRVIWMTSRAIGRGK
jgi:hypothetical protein